MKLYEKNRKTDKMAIIRTTLLYNDLAKRKYLLMKEPWMEFGVEGLSEDFISMCFVAVNSPCPGDKGCFKKTITFSVHEVLPVKTLQYRYFLFRN